MAHRFTVRPLVPDEWKTYRDLRLRALADSPEAFGRTLAEEEGRTDAEWSNRLTSAAGHRWNLPLVAEADAEAIGLAWGRIEQHDPEVAHLYQLWVAPSHRRHGAGQMLLEAVLNWAVAQNASCLELGVTLVDSPAMRLYHRAGFEAVGEPQPFRQGSALLSQAMRLRLGGAQCE